MRKPDKSRPLVWAAVAVIAISAGALLWATGVVRFSNPRAVLKAGLLSPTPSATPTPSPTATPSPTPSPQQAQLSTAVATTPLPSPTAGLPELPPVTPPPGGQVYVLTPAPDAVGWVRKGDEGANHFGDYNIYAGVYESRQHIGAVQFSLAGVPPGAPILYADLALAGLSAGWLGSGGAWQVELLEPWMDQDWPKKTFDELSGPSVAALALSPSLGSADLGAGRLNLMAFGPQALQRLGDRALTGPVSFRIVGPATGADNLFSWDSGYGANSLGRKPVLRIVAGPAPETPPAAPTLQLVVITRTPTPENVITAALQAATATAQATTTGTPTPLPANWVTPLVYMPSPTPANAATAAWHAAEATALAVLYGTPLPLPANAWTATPTPTPFVVTNTPTPHAWSTAIAQAEAEATRRAASGPPTPFPPNWITATPIRPTRVAPGPATAENRATVQAARAQATISALTTGTYTPMPWRYVTPTPLPLLIPVERITPTPLPTATPKTPSSLKGKIAFLSDRYGGSLLFVMDPDGSHVALLTQNYPYLAALLREPFAADGRRHAFVQPNERRVPQVFGLDPLFNSTWAITTMTGMAYGPAWSPVSDRILFVSTEAGNDEVYAIDADGTDLTRLTKNTWEWDKHPSWSPDGRRMVFFSNRGSGRNQIWMMNADGTGQKNISNNEYADWDPVWIK